VDRTDHTGGPTRRQLLAYAGVAVGAAAVGAVGFTATPAMADVTWRYPFDRRYPVSDGYGPREVPVEGGSSNHQGIDFIASEGVPIHAVGAGQVVTAGPLAGWGFGKLTRIQHDGYMSWYGHQSSIAVKVGQTVTAGQYIGKVGSTGVSSGDHLHLGISTGTSSSFIDPTFILDKPLATDSSAPEAPRDDDFRLIKSPGRGSAIVGAGYFRALPTAEFEACGLALAGPPIEGNDREFDVWKSIALSGTQA
jgi:hypothetical protein